MANIRADCIRTPVNRTPADYVPPNSTRRPVREGESFLSIANDLGINPPWKLVWFNFPTIGENFSQQGAAEVNWYLENTLGCTAVTPDGKNYKFHTGMKRPYIYIPVELIDMPGSTITVPKPKPKPNLFWYGGGMKQSQGAMVGPTAFESINGMLFSDFDSRYFSVSAQGTRTGLNLGIGGAGGVVLIATGVLNPGQLQGFKLNGFDFSAQLGPAAKAIGQGIRNAKAIGILTRLAARVAITAVEQEELRDLIKAALTSYGVSTQSATPQFHVIDLPLVSIGLEASLYYLDSTLTVGFVSQG